MPPFRFPCLSLFVWPYRRRPPPRRRRLRLPLDSSVRFSSPPSPSSPFAAVVRAFVSLLPRLAFSSLPVAVPTVMLLPRCCRGFLCCRLLALVLALPRPHPHPFLPPPSFCLGFGGLLCWVSGTTMALGLQEEEFTKGLHWARATDEEKNYNQ
jgi:hypothetical protein